MPDIDVPAIIEAAAAADCDRSYPYAMAHAAKVLPGIAEALYAPILALHNPERRWHLPADWESGYESAEAALEAYDDPQLGEGGLTYFEVCSECRTVEWQEEIHGEEPACLNSLHPCPTRRVVEANLAAIRGQSHA